jgi:serine/threonine protein phosphatase 1
MGNHEYVWNAFFLGSRKYDDFLMKFGGIQCLESYCGGKIDLSEAPAILKKNESVREMFPAEHREFFRAALPYYELDKFVCVHAGLNPDRKNEPLSGHDIEDMVFIREKFIRSEFLFNGKRIIFGHTAFNKPYMDPYKIGIDTGAVYGQGAKLTALNIEKMTFINHVGDVFTESGHNNAEVLFCD